MMMPASSARSASDQAVHHDLNQRAGANVARWLEQLQDHRRKHEGRVTGHEQTQQQGSDCAGTSVAASNVAKNNPR